MMISVFIEAGIQFSEAENHKNVKRSNITLVE